MRGESRSEARQRFTTGLSLTLACLSLSIAAPADAARQGHGRLVSAPGKPLEVVIPMIELTPADVAALKASIAPATLWTQSGLTPPVPVESLRVTVQPGATPTTRTLTVSSDQAVDQPVVDILLDVSTASGAGQVQVSFLMPVRAAASAGAGGSIVVSSGDTLFSIAQRHAVSGTSVYQMLWALYQANPQAFMQENMNLLRAGATMQIPDADTVRAIDPKFARDMFARHQDAFGRLRGKGVAAAAPARATPGTAQSGTVTAGGKAPSGPGGNQVRVTAASSEEQKQDAKVAAAKELAEIQSRVDALQQNVQQLKQALGNPAESGASAAGSPGATSPASASGASGASSGSAGAGSAVATAGGPAAGGGASAGAASATSAQTPAGTTAVGKAGTAGSSAGQTALDRMTSVLADNILAVITGVLALCALVIAWMMRRAGSRRDDENEDVDLASDSGTVASAAFEKKMQAIDLNLGETTETKNEPLVPKA